MAAFDFTKIRQVEDLLTGNDFGHVKLEWRMEPGPNDTQKRTYRIATPGTPGEHRAYFDTVGLAMDDFIAALKGDFAAKKGAADAQHAAMAQADAAIKAEWP